MQDQIPVSRNSEIEIELVESSKGDLDAVTGIVNWNYKMKTAESLTYNLIYNIKYDKTKSINLAYY